MFRLHSLGTARLALPCLPCSSWWILLDLLTAETASLGDRARTWAFCCRLWSSGPFWWSSWLHMPHWSPFLLWAQRIQLLRRHVGLLPWLSTWPMCCLSFGYIDLQSSSCHVGSDLAALSCECRRLSSCSLSWHVQVCTFAPQPCHSPDVVAYSWISGATSADRPSIFAASLWTASHLLWHQV